MLHDSCEPVPCWPASLCATPEASLIEWLQTYIQNLYIFIFIHSFIRSFNVLRVRIQKQNYMTRHCDQINNATTVALTDDLEISYYYISKI